MKPQIDLESTAFVEISDWIDDAIIDLRYCTDQNFLHRPLYDKPYAQLSQVAAQQLAQAAARLRQEGFRMVIWDAYRPMEIQKLLWQMLPDPNFVAPPERGSRHNFGMAVDLSLADLGGNYLQMPSDFDDFSDQARAHQEGLHEDVQYRLKCLQEAMVGAGFALYENEWWHFAYVGPCEAKPQSKAL